MTLSAVRVEEVTCRFRGVVALDELSMDVAPGTAVGVLGPNGAGKTTVLDVVAGVLRPTAGRVAVLGHDVGREGDVVRRLIGVVQQETALYEELSPRQNLRFSAALYRVADARRRIDELLGLIGLEARADDRCDRLSGGMRRRLVIARALLHRPQLLVLDEPTLGVDADARQAIWRHLQSLRAQGTTLILATNDLNEAAALCDRVVLLRAGRRAGEGTPAELIGRAARRVELDCRPDEVGRLAAALRTRRGVLEVKEEAQGITVQLNGGGTPEALVHDAAAMATLTGFRTREPDLAAVFQTLESAR